jgi:putative GTP pyrophosphokinase
MDATSGARPPRAEVEELIADFERLEPTLAALCARTKALIEACLQDAGIRYQSIQARVKTKRKLREKYLNPEKDYRRLSDITDLAGLRVITYYDDEVDRVAGVIEKEFRINTKESVDKRDIDPDRFGYRAINFVCGHSEKRTTDVEYKRFAGVLCEIQITSILGHAWSEIEHEWYDMRDAYPRDVKRRFSRIAALFELAGQEFVDIRDSRAKYERAVALQVQAKVPDVPVDVVSLRTFIEQDEIVAQVDASVAEALGMMLDDSLTDSVIDHRSRALAFAGLTKLQDVRVALGRFRSALPVYAPRCRQEVWPDSPSSSHAAGGICLYQLGSLLSAGRGYESAVGFFRSVLRTEPSWDLRRQVVIAREVIEALAS